MSIAEREAENAGPECAFQRLRLDMDDVRDAYIAGRTAEPCKEQVKAAAEALSAHMHEWAIDHGFDREVDNSFHCSCRAGGYTYKGLWGTSGSCVFERGTRGGDEMISEPFSFSLFIPGIPASKGSYRPITGRSRTTGKPVTRLIPMDKKERPWRDHVRDTILSHRTPTIPHDSYVTVETTFYLPRPKTIPPSKRKHPTVKPDIDKLQRALYDAITETHIWHDDCQITDVTSHKRYADDTPTGVFLTITWEPNQ